MNLKKVEVNIGEGFYGFSINLSKMTWNSEAIKANMVILGHRTIIHILITEMKFKSVWKISVMLDNPKLISPGINGLFQVRKRIKPPPAPKLDIKRKVKEYRWLINMKKWSNSKTKEIQFKTIVWAITLAKILNIHKIHYLWGCWKAGNLICCPLRIKFLLHF